MFIIRFRKYRVFSAVWLYLSVVLLHFLPVLLPLPCCYIHPQHNADLSPTESHQPGPETQRALWSPAGGEEDGAVACFDGNAVTEGLPPALPFRRRAELWVFPFGFPFFRRLSPAAGGQRGKSAAACGAMKIIQVLLGSPGFRWGGGFRVKWPHGKSQLHGAGTQRGFWKWWILGDGGQRWEC